jgi:hypothetical protein
MGLNLIARFAAAEEIFDAISAYDGFEALMKLLRKKYKLPEITALLQQSFLLAAHPAGMPLAVRQSIAIRIAGNIENMRRGMVVRDGPDHYSSDSETELARLLAVRPTNEFGDKPTEFIGLTGMWAGLRLRSDKAVTGRRLFRLVNKGRERGVIRAYSELNGHVFALDLRVVEGKPRVFRATLPDRVLAYNRQLRRARLTRGDRCRGTCLGCAKKQVADAGDAGSLYGVCCPLTGGKS